MSRTLEDWPANLAIQGCEFCAEAEPMRLALATHVVGGYQLCEDHAIEEVTDIVRHPGSFVHSWPSGEDVEMWRDAVPFRTVIISLALYEPGDFEWRLRCL
jgi:hypothetical protein